MIEMLKLSEPPAGLTNNQMAYLDSFDAGARLVINRLREKLYYIPEQWKQEGNTLALYDIVDNTLQDLERMIDSHRQEVSEHG